MNQLAFNKQELEKVYNKLSLVDRMKLNGYINKEIEKVTEETVKNLCSEYNYIVDSSILDFFNCDIETLAKLKKVSVEYREDFLNVVKKFKSEKEYEDYMENINIELIDKIDECINNGLKQNDVLKVVKREFEGVSKATIINTYKARKKELEPITKVVEDTEVLAGYILEEEKEIKEEKKSKFRVEYKEIEVIGEKCTWTVKGGKLNGIDPKEQISNLDFQIRKLEEDLKDVKERRNEALEVIKEFLK